MPPRLTNEIIDAAIEGFEAQRRRIGDQISELRAMRSDSPAPLASPSTKQPPRKMSAAGRKAIAAAQRQRWAASKDEAQTSAPKAKPAKKKRILSTEGKAHIVAALKRRWAAKKAAAKK